MSTEVYKNIYTKTTLVNTKCGDKFDIKFGVKA